MVLLIDEINQVENFNNLNFKIEMAISFKYSFNLKSSENFENKLKK